MTSEKIPAGAITIANGEQKPAEMHFIVQNVSKKHNIGTICRNCTAFDVKSMHLVGSAHYNVFGSQGSDAHVKIEHHPTLEECRETMKETYNVEEIFTRMSGLSGTNSISYGFRGATIFNGDISKWDTSHVTDMSFMFENALAFNSDISLSLIHI